MLRSSSGSKQMYLPTVICPLLDENDSKMDLQKTSFLNFWSVFWGSVWPCVRLGTPTNHQACLLTVFLIFSHFFITFVHDLIMFSCSLAEVCPGFWRGSTQACLLNIYINIYIYMYIWAIWHMDPREIWLADPQELEFVLRF